MPLITHALLYAGYALLALTTGLGLAQVGGATIAEASLGALSLFCACAVTHGGLSAAHAAGAVGRSEKKARAETDKLRAAHREVVAEMDAMSDRIDRLDTAVTEVAHRRIEPAPQQEFKLLDQIVSRCGASPGFLKPSRPCPRATAAAPDPPNAYRPCRQSGRYGSRCAAG